jgi:dolichyl-phosphate beta-glucosyltransferase
MKTLSIILPVYNTADILSDNLEFLINYLGTLKNEYEIIIVDDGSFSGKDIDNIAGKNGCRYLRNNKNLGKGASIKRGMLEATGECRIFTDADIPYEIESIGLMIEKFQNEKCDVIIGDRTLVKSEYKSGSFLRSLGSRFFSLIVWGITSGKFEDTPCGLKGFGPEAAENIFSKTRINGFAIDVELLYIATKNDLKIEKIPVKLRAHNPSTVSVIRHGLRMLYDLVKIKINQLRKKYE